MTQFNFEYEIWKIILHPHFVLHNKNISNSVKWSKISSAVLSSCRVQLKVDVHMLEIQHFNIYWAEGSEPQETSSLL